MYASTKGGTWLSLTTLSNEVHIVSVDNFIYGVLFNRQIIKQVFFTFLRRVTWCCCDVSYQLFHVSLLCTCCRRSIQRSRWWFNLMKWISPPFLQWINFCHYFLTVICHCWRSQRWLAIAVWTGCQSLDVSALANNLEANIFYYMFTCYRRTNENTASD